MQEFLYFCTSYILDTLLGEDPTINETTVCTYPEPWYPGHTTARKPIDKALPASRALNQYLGVYNHIAYGNLTVSLNHTVNQLQVGFEVNQSFIKPLALFDVSLTCCKAPYRE